MRKAFIAAVGLVAGIVSPAVAGVVKTHYADKDWRGWRFIYHRDSDGRLAQDKFAIAIVIADKPSPSWNLKSTGQWVGCVWLPVTRYVLTNKTATLTFTPPGERYTFK